MDTPKRTWTKAILWQALGLFSMLVVGFLFTGSIAVGGAMAVVNALIGLTVYILFERAWNRISWGRIPISEDLKEGLE
ncbi:DUF2061 domain-containing protein [Halocynthiibacter styelae]|uniref:DUF2061 domain-containing protein n=1 Tax=Halocynthiibacter styelae TaxID=2761955 RepID=A0A8J7LPP9_9RHOB|nr:DUF2061 domain-containing protein [Paenihalocynthiibacter styelae]MBI1493112.1 DUF2061 domain-containing protein [Paenihalocynthiibacter styelae]